MTHKPGGLDKPSGLCTMTDRAERKAQKLFPTLCRKRASVTSK